MTVKLIRCPINTSCSDCNDAILFGVYVYYDEETGAAICIECGTERGWMSKQRVRNIIKKLELKEDLRALRAFKKILIRELLQARRRLSLHKLGENDLEIEKQIEEMMSKVRSYLKALATPEEKEALTTMYDEIRKCQRLQADIRKRIEDALFLLDKDEEKIQQKLAEERAKVRV